MCDQVKVSVIVPVYNNEAYLRHGLDSILVQTVKEIEIICVDDGSTDTSGSILEEYAQKDERIKVIRQKNQGAGVARNNGFMHAKGEYVYFFDSDDLCAKNLIEKTLNAAKKEAADIVCFNFERFDDQGHRVIRKGYHSEWLPANVEIFNYKDCPTRILSIVNPTPWNKLIRRSFIEERGLKYEEITSTNDITFSAVSAANARRIVVLPDVLYYYRVGHSNTISSSKSKNLRNIITAIESTIRQIRKLPYYDEISPSLKRFEVDNYIFALSHYISDFTTPEAKDFYTFIHNRFNSDEYLSLTEIECGYKKLFDMFRIIQANNYEMMNANIRRRLIVSLTTYPARIADVRYVLDTIYAQTRKADEVVLWLAEEQFPGKEEELPRNLTGLIQNKKLTIRWCDDLKPHKKYFYALQEYRNDLIVTLDDDLLYHPNLLENLYISYLIHPEAVSAARVHLMTMDEEKKVLPYDCWVKEFDGCIGEPSMHLLCTGGAGALYPAHLFDLELFDKQSIIDNCLFADDIWLKIMELIAGIPVVVSEKYVDLKYIPGSQTERLCDANVELNQNDIQYQKSVEWAEEKFGKGCIEKGLLNSGIGVNLMKMEVVCRFLAAERKRLSSRNGHVSSKPKEGTKEAAKVVVNTKGQTTGYEHNGTGVLVKGIAKKIVPERMKPFIKKLGLRIPHKTKMKIKKIIHW
ncbi:MAG: glycosyltransferase [Clostridia bacterium]|nr:glycosyltransferase [Clostridia bacterium]